jgi:hypothetical protein
MLAHVHLRIAAPAAPVCETDREIILPAALFAVATGREEPPGDAKKWGGMVRKLFQEMKRQ